MKDAKINVYKAFISLIAVFGIIFITSTFAQQPETKKTESSAPDRAPVKTEESVESSPVKPPEDFLSAGQNIDVKSEGTIGDVAVAGANVTISERALGYVMAAAANVNINAPVGNDLWAAGAQIFVNAPVSDNAMLAGSTVIIQKDGTIGNDVRIAASTVDIKARINRNLRVSAANVRISSEVGGDVEIYAQNVSLDPGAKVLGNLVVHGPNEPIVSSGAKVFGNVEHRKIESTQTTGSSIRNWFGGWFIRFLWITVLGLVAVWFSPVWTDRVATAIRAHTGKSFLIGLLVILAMPILLLLLLITVAGLPLALLLGALTVVAALLSAVFVSYLTGEWFLKQLKRWEKSNVLKIIFGALIVTLVMSLP
ncbi:MAG: hypothetical protein HKN25_13900, partial [Pyrinomonadaceae bacterium]|nr:hypothetical protein [Pyrinomonadaceae bacterium]